MYSLIPIGRMHSCFKEKFAIPRQPLLAKAATGFIELYPPYDHQDAIAGLEQVSHIWLLFIFHQTIEKNPRLKVRPPRLGGNKSLGVFATRSTFRPNNIGQSVVKIEKIINHRIYVSGIDLLDNTPIIDIKPYVPYADIIEGATNAIAPAPPQTIEVIWHAVALQQAKHYQQHMRRPIIELTEQCLMQNPKPAYQKTDVSREYGTIFWNLDIKWHYLNDSKIEVLSVIGH